VVYRYDLLSQFASPDAGDLKETVRLIRELEVLTRGVECPRPTGFSQKEGRFIGSEVHPLQDDAFNRLVVDGECVIPYKLSRDYGPAQGGRETRQSVIPA
jgi:hypothetical protein